MSSKVTHIPQSEGRRLELDNQEEEELFDINLEVVDNIPPPNYYWESYLLSTGNALLANCLLPVTELSGAVPVLSGFEYDITSVSLLSLPVSDMAEMQKAGKAEDILSIADITNQGNDLFSYYLPEYTRVLMY